MGPRRGPVRCHVGLGSNLGDRLVNVQRAVDLLAGRDGIRVVAASRVYETAPVGPRQPDYANAVVELETTLGPRALLEACLDIETRMGRVRRERWGPRVIDLDVLSYDSQDIEEPGLSIPHPRMHERAFVLVPLLELDPDPPLPGGRRVGTLRTAALGLEGVQPLAPPPRVP